MEDRLLIDEYWVGHTHAWIIPGTEDLRPYITAKDKQKNYPEHPYWNFTTRWKNIEDNYIYAAEHISKTKINTQQDIFSMQQELDKKLPSKLKKSKDRKKAEDMMNQFTAAIYKMMIL